MNADYEWEGAEEMQRIREALHSSEKTEWYTPPEYIDLVYAVMGTIDLDPASCEAANNIVDAAKIYTKEDDGLAHADEWQGKVFLNPPYGKTKGKSNQGTWSAALRRQHDKGYVEEAMMLLNAVPDRNWFKPLWNYPLCFCYDRIAFIDEDGNRQESPTHPNVFVYLPPIGFFEESGTKRFERHFKSVGRIVRS